MSVLSEIYRSQSGIRGARSGRGIQVPVSSVMARCAAPYDREHSDVRGNMQKKGGNSDGVCARALYLWLSRYALSGMSKSWKPVDDAAQSTSSPVIEARFCAIDTEIRPTRKRCGVY